MLEKNKSIQLRFSNVESYSEQEALQKFKGSKNIQENVH